MFYISCYNFNTIVLFHTNSLLWVELGPPQTPMLTPQPPVLQPVKGSRTTADVIRHAESCCSRVGPQSSAKGGLLKAWLGLQTQARTHAENTRRAWKERPKQQRYKPRGAKGCQQTTRNREGGRQEADSPSPGKEPTLPPTACSPLLASGAVYRCLEGTGLQQPPFCNLHHSSVHLKGETHSPSCA